MCHRHDRVACLLRRDTSRAITVGTHAPPQWSTQPPVDHRIGPKRVDIISLWPTEGPFGDPTPDKSTGDCWTALSHETAKDKMVSNRAQAVDSGVRVPRALPSDVEVLRSQYSASSGWHLKVAKQTAISTRWSGAACQDHVFSRTPAAPANEAKQ